MRIMTVTCDAWPVAVLRANSAEEAAGDARAMLNRAMPGRLGEAARLEVREPTDGEMIEWLRRREAFLFPRSEIGV
jgi:hypothetical protein